MPSPLDLVQDPDSGSVFVTVTGYNDAAQDIASDILELQIERYVYSDTSAKVWRDWTSLDLLGQPQEDKNILSGRTVGYRMRYRSLDGSLSAWTNWVTIVT